MKKSFLLPAIFLGLVGLVVVAVLADTSRLLDKEQQTLNLIETQMETQEQRLISSLEAYPSLPEELKKLIDEYKQSANRTDRLSAFQKLSIASKTSLAQFADPENVMGRSLADEILGAINRHRILDEDFQKCNRSVPRN